MDGDNSVTAADVPLFVQALVDRASYDALGFTTPTGFRIDADLSGDMNQDGTFDLGDIKQFSMLFSPSTAAANVPEPTSALLAVAALFRILSAR